MKLQDILETLYGEIPTGFRSGNKVKVGFPSVDNILQNPEYHADAKRTKASTVMMTPDEYIDHAVKILKKVYDDHVTRDSVIRSREDTRAERHGLWDYEKSKPIHDYTKDAKTAVDVYVNYIMSGKKFNNPMLDYAYNPSQEGLHRVLAMKKVIEELKHKYYHEDKILDALDNFKIPVIVKSGTKIGKHPGQRLKKHKPSY